MKFWRGYIAVTTIAFFGALLCGASAAGAAIAMWVSQLLYCIAAWIKADIEL